MKNIIGIYNYASSNSISVASALDAIDVNYKLSEDFEKLKKYNKIIIPGVGNMESFIQENSVEFLKKNILDFIKNGGLIYGICLGMQLLFNHSKESKTGKVNTLGILSGEVVSLKSDCSYNLNVGYKKIFFDNKNSKIIKHLFKGINQKEKFYFLHKFYCKNLALNYEKIDVNYKNIKVPALVYNNNILGTQFHPELSKAQGLKFLKNFSKLSQ